MQGVRLADGCPSFGRTPDSATAQQRLAATHALHSRGWIKRARAVLLRRGTDPWQSHETHGLRSRRPAHHSASSRRSYPRRCAGRPSRSRQGTAATVADARVTPNTHACRPARSGVTGTATACGGQHHSQPAAYRVGGKGYDRYISHARFEQPYVVVWLTCAWSSDSAAISRSRLSAQRLHRERVQTHAVRDLAAKRPAHAGTPHAPVGVISATRENPSRGCWSTTSATTSRSRRATTEGPGSTPAREASAIATGADRTHRPTGSAEAPAPSIFFGSRVFFRRPSSPTPGSRQREEDRRWDDAGAGTTRSPPEYPRRTNGRTRLDLGHAALVLRSRSGRNVEDRESQAQHAREHQDREDHEQHRGERKRQ